jgi:hypothetical protein
MMAVLWVTASAGLVIIALWAPAAHFGEHSDVHPVFGRLVRRTALISLSVAAGLLILGLLAWRDPGHALLGPGIAAGVSIAGSAPLIHLSEVHQTEIYRRFGINRVNDN